MTTTHELTQAVPPRLQMRGSWRSKLTLFHHCREFGVSGCAKMLLHACEDNTKPSDARQGDVCIGGRDLAGVDACAMELTLRCLVLDLADRFGRKSWN